MVMCLRLELKETQGYETEQQPHVSLGSYLRLTGRKFGQRLWCCRQCSSFFSWQGFHCNQITLWMFLQWFLIFGLFTIHWAFELYRRSTVLHTKEPESSPHICDHLSFWTRHQIPHHSVSRVLQPGYRNRSHWINTESLLNHCHNPAEYWTSLEWVRLIAFADCTLIATQVAYIFNDSLF